MAKESINVALIGQGFMGRTHSNGWGQAQPLLQAAGVPCCSTVPACRRKNRRSWPPAWRLQNSSIDWKATVASPEIDLVDIVTPNFMHAPRPRPPSPPARPSPAKSPSPARRDEAREMAEMAKKAKVKTFVWYNYRRVPAIALAQQAFKEGAVGDIRHVRAKYLQDWADDSVPLVWRFDKKLAGSGAHGDLNAHIIDMTRFVTGAEITEITRASPRRSSRNASS